MERAGTRELGLRGRTTLAGGRPQRTFLLSAGVIRVFTMIAPIFLLPGWFNRSLPILPLFHLFLKLLLSDPPQYSFPLPQAPNYPLFFLPGLVKNHDSLTRWVGSFPRRSAM